MKRELNKWQFGIKMGKTLPEMHPDTFHPYIRIWFLKFISFSAECLMFSKENYKGFYLDFCPIKDVIMYQKSFKFLGKWRRIVFPIKIIIN